MDDGVIIIGIDPGVSTGVAQYESGVLEKLWNIEPHELAAFIANLQCDGVVFEDSRLQTHVWNGERMPIGVKLSMARKIGRVDALCWIIERQASESGVKLLGVSPKGKGAKMATGPFNKLTGWTGRSNEHNRDAAIVAWPWRNGFDLQS